jgi:hypothetical protein
MTGPFLIAETRRNLRRWSRSVLRRKKHLDNAQFEVIFNLRPAFITLKETA